jgi:hypothetical protein
VQDAAIKRAPESQTTSPETADLLEALRRRRGQRETAPLVAGADDEHDEQSPISLFEAFDEPLDDPEPAAPAPSPASTESHDGGGRRRRRNAMPSWDEIVFGARTDE